MRAELTDGSIIIQADICDCGLTSGCEKCKPIIIEPKRRILLNYERIEPTVNKIWKEVNNAATE